MRFKRQVGIGDRAVFFRCLALMFLSGIHLGRAFDILSGQSEHQELRRAARETGERLRGGSSLSRALLQARAPLSPFTLKLVQLGESTGTLGVLLTRLAEHEEKLAALQHRVRAQLTYPCILAGLCLLAVVALPPWLFGALRPMLGNGGLPWFSRCVLGLSQFLGSPFLWFLALVLAYRFRHLLVRKIVEMPVLSSTISTLRQARFLRSLALALETGLPLQQSLLLAGGCSDLEAPCREAMNAVLAGATVAQGLAASGAFSSVVVQGVRAGEESGKLCDMLRSLAQLFELELETSIRRFLDLLEPMLMMLMGFAAGAFIIATALPILRVVERL
ncbi:type II secretion system F family protein [bacterium]|nr:type II secretion system F family protein [bacterium]